MFRQQNRFLLGKSPISNRVRKLNIRFNNVFKPKVPSTLKWRFRILNVGYIKFYLQKYYFNNFEKLPRLYCFETNTYMYVLVPNFFNIKVS